MAGQGERRGRHSGYDRVRDDWYVEPSWAVEALINAVDFMDNWIWDPACGLGTIPEAFAARRHPIIASDIVDRGYSRFAEECDFLEPGVPLFVKPGQRVSIVTNPPYGRLLPGMPRGDTMAERFIRKALTVIDHRLAVLVPVSFLASGYRLKLFQEFPPSDVLVLSDRPSMPPGEKIAELADRAFKGGTTDFVWIVWTRPHDRETRTRWIERPSA